ncbi:MAG: TniQ family protein [Actinobacteria bacterium]|nr:TniQ family protein [Actinomycetota bacterium]
MRLEPGEWLHSAISRWAWEIFGVSRGALLKSFGLGSASPSTINAIGTRLEPAIVAAISRATGIPELRLREATMQELDGKLLWLTMNGFGKVANKVAKGALWSWQAGTRYCPDCIREQPGVFHLVWRSPWSFACVRHQRLLHDSCSACHKSLVEMRGSNRDLFDPSTCRANLEPAGATRTTPCRAPLADTWDELWLEPDSPPMRAQQEILRRVEDGTVMEMLCSLQPAAIGLSGARALHDIAELSGLDAAELAGLLDDEKRVGVSAPKNAYAMAALTGAAFELISRDDARSQAIIRNATFARAPAPVPRNAGYGPGSPRELIGRWPSAPTKFRAQILRALDADLTTGQRILWDSVARSSEPNDDETRLYDREKRFAGIPSHLWPDWCSRLDVGGQVDAATLARSLTRVVQVAGARDLPNVFVEFGVADVLRHNMLGTSRQTNAVLAGISELGHTVDKHDLVIDYPRRLNLPLSQMLPFPHWQLLAASVRMIPGADRRHRNVRRYLWQRLTGCGIREFPEQLRMGRSRGDTFEYTLFCTQMTVDLQRGLDGYAQAFLEHHGIHEPVTWSPPPAAGTRWVGPEILDLDIDRLHYLLRCVTYIHRQLSDALQVSPRRIVRAIDKAPPPTVHNITHLNWSQHLPPRAAGDPIDD